MIHQYKLNGYNIVLDVYSGSVHLVDDVAYDIIQLFCDEEPEAIIETICQRYDDVTKEDVEEVLEALRSLEAAGKLFTPDIYRDKAGAMKNRHETVKALCLHVAHSCNLTCSYCFAAQGKFNGKAALMSPEVGKRAIDFLIENSGGRRNLEVDFFGGEPLLNLDMVKEVVAYARSIEKAAGKNFRFTLTTNGVNIDDDMIEFVNKEMDNVVLSLDGRKEIHDKERKLCDGRGSYDIVVPKFKKLVDSRNGEKYYMRGTFTHHNPDFLEDVIHIADLGFTELSMEPVVGPEGEPSTLTEEDKAIVMDAYEKLALEMLKREEEGRPFNFYHYTVDLVNGPCVYKRLSGCGSGTEYFAVTPWGDLYPCHQFVGDEECKMGNIWDGITESKLLDEFRGCNVYAREECDDCWAKLYCSGGCSANAYHATGKITGIYDYGCQLFRKRIECAIMMEVARGQRENQEGSGDSNVHENK